MIKETYLDRFIGQKLLEQNDKERAEHKSSGKLSASMLGQPLQWQILKTIGVPAKPFDEYTLRKFKRGKDIEKWFVSELPEVPEAQKFAEYRDTIGFIDAVVAQDESFDFPLGILPHEVKSVTNLKFKRVVKEGADRSHKLQATLYALGMKSKYYAIDYIASDDLRIETYIYETKDTQAEVDEVITKFQEQLKLKVVPVFEAIEKWQENSLYQNYPEWATLTAEECMDKLKSEFPDAYKKLTT